MEMEMGTEVKKFNKNRKKKIVWIVIGIIAAIIVFDRFVPPIMIKGLVKEASITVYGLGSGKSWGGLELSYRDEEKIEKVYEIEKLAWQSRGGDYFLCVLKTQPFEIKVTYTLKNGMKITRTYTGKLNKEELEDMIQDELF